MDADVDAALAELDAELADELALDADVEAADALDAALVAAVSAFVSAVSALVSAVSAAACAASAAACAASASATAVPSITRSHLAESALELIGVVPLEVCAVLQRYTLELLESLTRSRTVYDVPAAQLPRQLPISSPTTGLPFASNARVLPARDALAGRVIAISVGSVTGALSPRSAVSATCCA